MSDTPGFDWRSALWNADKYARLLRLEQQVQLLMRAAGLQQGGSLMSQLDELRAGEANLQAQIDALVAELGPLEQRAAEAGAPDLADDIARIASMAQQVQAAASAAAPQSAAPASGAAQAASPEQSSGTEPTQESTVEPSA